MPIDVTLLAAKTRFVVVHYHIFKNGGSTVEHILNREFPGSFARLHGPTSDAVLDGENLAVFLKEHPGVDAVTSHHLRYPLPVIRNTVLFDCCFLRHPLERLDSLYSYYRKIDSTEPLCRMAHRCAPVEFFRHLIDRAPEQVANVQVVQLANGGAFTRPAHEGDLDRAVRIVRNMAFPGVVEMFRESLVAAEYFMRPAFPSLRLNYSGPANMSRPALASAEQRQQRLLDRWGTGLYNELKKLNSLDIELVARATQEIERRLDLTAGLSGRIAEFDSRCQELAASVG